MDDLFEEVLQEKATNVISTNQPVFGSSKKSCEVVDCEEFSSLYLKTRYQKQEDVRNFVDKIPVLGVSHVDDSKAEFKPGNKAWNATKVLQRNDSDIIDKCILFAVLAKRNEPLSSSSGKQYSNWILSDLGPGTENCLIKLNLFGKANDSHWKVIEGTLILLRNCKVFVAQKHENKPSSLVLSVYRPDDLLVVGLSKHFSYCQALTASSQRPCTRIVNTSQTLECVYHYRQNRESLKHSFTKRRELKNGSMIPVVQFGSQTQIIPHSMQKPKPEPANNIFRRRSSDMENLDPSNTISSNRYSRGTRNLSMVESSTELNASDSNDNPIDGCKRSKQSFSAKQFLREVRKPQDIVLGTRDEICNVNNFYKAQQKVKEAMIKRLQMKGITLKPNNPNELGKLSFSSQIVSTQSVSIQKTSTLSTVVSMTQEEMKRVIEAKSIFDQDVERESEIKNFERLLMQEQIQDRTNKVNKLETMLWRCKTCDLSSYQLNPLCKRENHEIQRMNATKRFFSCRDCKSHTYTLNSKFPTKPCRCGSMNFQKAGITREKRGPKLPTEILSIDQPIS